MKKAPHSPIATWLTIFSLLVTMTGGIMVGDNAHAQPANSNSGRDKVSEDLREKVKGAKSDERVNVIIEPTSSWSSSLNYTVTGNGGKVSKTFKNFTSRTVSLPPAAVEALANNPEVAYVSLDRPVKLLGHVSLTTGADAARNAGGSTPYDGTGIGIAVMDSGIYGTHVAYESASKQARISVSVDFTGENRTDDPYGHGSHVAGILAGNDNVSSGAYLGVAPNANLVNLRVLDSQGKGSVSGLLSALDWVMNNRTTYNIRVVNMSLGTAAVSSYKDDPLCKAVRKLVDAGVVVVAAAGNEGKDSNGQEIYGQIHSPGNEPSVITVGASNSYGTDSRGDDTVTTYSSRGPTRSYWTDSTGIKHYDNLIKPDVVAPGNRLISVQSMNNYLVANNPSLDANVSGSASREQMFLSGSSMATPVVSGAAALLLQANPQLTPNLVKMILMYTAQPLAGFNMLEQGAGQLNLEGAMRLAKLIRTDLTSSTALGSSLLCSSCAAPTPQTTLGGYTFSWSQGIILDYTYATGTNLITKYQKIYGLGVLLGDGTIENNGVLVGDTLKLSGGVLLGDNIMTAGDTNSSTLGITLGEGTAFQSTGVLVGDKLHDGVLLGDGVLYGDGVMLGDGVLYGDVCVQANQALIYGDKSGSAMSIVKDPAPKAPTGLAAKAASSSQINLTWSDAANNEDGFKVERSLDGKAYAQIATVGRNVKSYSSTGLTANKKYYYRIRAYHSGGDSAYTTAVSATTSR
ncbi:MAG TPA: S8 family serine peptidase [Pyrinomonadaceae bacterium]|nr:S8 family serine peptidase [Pyrinomonadaceae bacterium]